MTVSSFADMMQRSVLSRLVLASLVATGFAVSAHPLSAEPAADAGDASRVVAIGDVHGELDGLTTLLQKAGLVDDERHWVGGRATLVQLGDVLDRGADALTAAELLMRLQEEAAAAGGEVVVLMGNHEQMNLLGIYDDVPAAALEALIDERSSARRRRAYEAQVRWERSLDNTAGSDPEPGSTEHRQQWMGEHPPGWVEYQESMGPDGVYGKWIRERPVAVVRGGVLFVHAGLSDAWAERSLEQINQQHWDVFAGFDRVRGTLVSRRLAPPTATYAEIGEVLRDLVAQFEAAVDPEAGGHRPPPPLPAELLNSLLQDFAAVRATLTEDAPLWFRGYALWEPEDLRPLVERTLATHGAERVAVGHTPLGQHFVHGRHHDRVFLVDTGMLTPVYGGRASALVIDDGSITAIYPGLREVLVDGTNGHHP